MQQRYKSMFLGIYVSANARAAVTCETIPIYYMDTVWMIYELSINYHQSLVMQYIVRAHVVLQFFGLLKVCFLSI